MNKALKNGFKLSNDGILICLAKEHVSLSFDHIISTTSGFVTDVKMNVIQSIIVCNAMVSSTFNKCYNINHLHKIFGHCDLKMLKSAAKIHNFNLFGNVEVCKDCAIEKAKQKNFNKVWLVGSKIPEERIHIDISLINEISLGGAKSWALVVDDCSDYFWSFFLK
jgi:hypothetical protein